LEFIILAKLLDQRHYNVCKNKLYCHLEDAVIGCKPGIVVVSPNPVGGIVQDVYNPLEVWCMGGWAKNL
jgi:hypothetical protein